MKSVHLQSGEVFIQEANIPECPAHYALIRVLAAGICNTDLELQRGYYDFCGTPGHEFVGQVVHAATPALVGKRVVGEINLTCGDCEPCRRNQARHCQARKVLGILGHPGAFAEYLTLPECNLHIVPDQIPTEAAVFVEPLAAACTILDQIRSTAGEPVAVLGDGKLGLLIVYALQAHGVNVTLFGRHEASLAWARTFGARSSLGTDRPRKSFATIVEATGSEKGLGEAIEMVRPQGTIVMKSTIHSRVSVDTARLVVDEITLVGSRCGRFEPALDLLHDRSSDLISLIAAEYPLTEAARAFKAAAQPGVLKVLLRND